MCAAAEHLAAAGADVVLISCAADPGLAEARAAVAVPVVGAGSSAAALALAVGGRIGVLGIEDEAPESVRSMLGDRLVGVARPAGVHTTIELCTPRGRDAAMAAARRIVADGAQTVLFACTGLTTLGLAATVRSECGVPVVDPVLAAGHMAIAAGARQENR